MDLIAFWVVREIQVSVSTIDAERAFSEMRL